MSTDNDLKHRTIFATDIIHEMTEVALGKKPVSISYPNPTPSKVSPTPNNTCKILTNFDVNPQCNSHVFDAYKQGDRGLKEKFFSGSISEHEVLHSVELSQGHDEIRDSEYAMGSDIALSSEIALPLISLDPKAKLEYLKYDFFLEDKIIYSITGVMLADILASYEFQVAYAKAMLLRPDLYNLSNYLDYSLSSKEDWEKGGFTPGTDTHKNLGWDINLHQRTVYGISDPFYVKQNDEEGDQDEEEQDNEEHSEEGQIEEDIPFVNLHLLRSSVTLHDTLQDPKVFTLTISETYLGSGEVELPLRHAKGLFGLIEYSEYDDEKEHPYHAISVQNPTMSWAESCNNTALGICIEPSFDINYSTIDNDLAISCPTYNPNNILSLKFPIKVSGSPYIQWSMFLGNGTDKKLVYNNLYGYKEGDMLSIIQGYDFQIAFVNAVISLCPNIEIPSGYVLGVPSQDTWEATKFAVSDTGISLAYDFNVSYIADEETGLNNISLDFAFKIAKGSKFNHSIPVYLEHMEDWDGKDKNYPLAYYLLNHDSLKEDNPSLVTSYTYPYESESVKGYQHSSKVALCWSPKFIESSDKKQEVTAYPSCNADDFKNASWGTPYCRFLCPSNGKNVDISKLSYTFYLNDAENPTITIKGKSLPDAMASYEFQKAFVESFLLPTISPFLESGNNCFLADAGMLYLVDESKLGVASYTTRYVLTPEDFVFPSREEWEEVGFRYKPYDVSTSYGGDYYGYQNYMNFNFSMIFIREDVSSYDYFHEKHIAGFAIVESYTGDTPKDDYSRKTSFMSPWMTSATFKAKGVNQIGVCLKAGTLRSSAGKTWALQDRGAYKTSDVTSYSSSGMMNTTYGLSDSQKSRVTLSNPAVQAFNMPEIVKGTDDDGKVWHKLVLISTNQYDGVDVTFESDKYYDHNPDTDYVFFDYTPFQYFYGKNGTKTQFTPQTLIAKENGSFPFLPNNTSENFYMNGHLFLSHLQVNTGITYPVSMMSLSVEVTNNYTWDEFVSQDLVEKYVKDFTPYYPQAFALVDDCITTVGMNTQPKVRRYIDSPMAHHLTYGETESGVNIGDYNLNLVQLPGHYAGTVQPTNWDQSKFKYNGLFMKDDRGLWVGCTDDSHEFPTHQFSILISPYSYLGYAYYRTNLSDDKFPVDDETGMYTEVADKYWTDSPCTFKVYASNYRMNRMLLDLVRKYGDTFTKQCPWYYIPGRIEVRLRPKSMNLKNTFDYDATPCFLEDDYVWIPYNVSAEEVSKTYSLFTPNAEIAYTEPCDLYPKGASLRDLIDTSDKEKRKANSVEFIRLMSYIRGAGFTPSTYINTGEMKSTSNYAKITLDSDIATKEDKTYLRLRVTRGNGNDTISNMGYYVYQRLMDNKRYVLLEESGAGPISTACGKNKIRFVVPLLTRTPIENVLNDIKTIDHFQLPTTTDGATTAKIYVDGKLIQDSFDLNDGSYDDSLYPNLTALGVILQHRGSEWNLGLADGTSEKQILIVLNKPTMIQAMYFEVAQDNTKNNEYLKLFNGESVVTIRPGGENSYGTDRDNWGEIVDMLSFKLGN